MLTAWKIWAKRLKLEIVTLYLAYQDPRMPWLGRIVAALVVAYAFSPIDLIPDFIPVLGYLDDLIVLPLGVTLAVRMIPADLLAECRVRAQAQMHDEKPIWWGGAIIIILVWLAILAGMMFFYIYQYYDIKF